jgi:hypothetical protein
MHPVSGADDPDESLNDLAQIAARYPGRERPAILDPGDAVFFGHYCNARSHVPWDDEPLEHGQMGDALVEHAL